LWFGGDGGGKCEFAMILINYEYAEDGKEFRAVVSYEGFALFLELASGWLSP